MISMILAVANDNAIGLNNKLPWAYSKEDMAHFREKTLGKTVLMGHNTWKGFNKPLPNRRNVVATTTHYDNVETISGTVDEITDSLGDFVVIGGANLYYMFKEKAKIIYLTRFNLDVEYDTHINLDVLLEGFVKTETTVVNNIIFETWETV